MPRPTHSRLDGLLSRTETQTTWGGARDGGSGDGQPLRMLSVAGVPMACIFEFLTCLMADDAALPHWFPVRTSASPFAEFGGAHTVSAPVSRKPPQTRNGRNPKKTEGPP